MTRTIDIPTFQAAVVRNCSPTLAGIKPASLFTYPGTYAHGDGSVATETIAERRARLLNVIAQCNRELDPFGIHLSVLVWRPCGALVYVYRAKSLTTLFRGPSRQNGARLGRLRHERPFDMPCAFGITHHAREQ